MIIRNAIPEDVESIFALIHELAVFERAPHEMVNTKADLLRDGFGEHPLYVCFVAEVEDRVCGISLCYIRYSTWKGSCLYLEDLIVNEPMRGKGIGKALFAYTLKYAKEKNYARVQWQVLDWNESAINFYKLFNAEFDGEWLNAWINTGNQK